MRTHLMAVPMLGLAVLLAACGSGAASPSCCARDGCCRPPEAPSAAAPSAAAAGPRRSPSPTPAWARCSTDGKGMTLYVFTPDKAGDSTCYDKCATAWPPV